ncbi:MAG: adenosylmethionine--8-amino-7-oxononanoate transaminase [Bacteroidota bacterium]
MSHPNIWQPFTILKGAQEPLRVQKGEGIWITLEDGRRLVDCISSWWVTLHGHAQPEIADAIARQARELEHVIFANFSHRPAEQLAERITGHLPPGINRLFFSDNGSTAVEVSLKIAWQYWKNQGENRRRFLAFEGAYHGDTMGAMSVGGRSVFNQVFEELLFDVEYLPYPETWEGDEGIRDKEDRILDMLDEKLTQHPGKYAGIVIEPLIQGAGGMRVCRERFLQQLQRITRQRETLLLFDEVMTGFGRTGSLFAHKRAGVDPDLIALSKGISGGFLPLAATAVSDTVYDAFYTDDPMGTLWHGHSYTANPLGCAAGLASLDLLEADPHRYERLEGLHRKGMESIAQRPEVERIRFMGTIAAFQIKTEGSDGYFNEIGSRIKARCMDHGLLLRPLGNTVYLMPPFRIEPHELANVYRRLDTLLDEVSIRK